MPTLVRLLTIVAIIAAIVYAIMAALIFFVEPTQREVIIDVPLPQLEEAVPEAGNEAAAENRP